MIIDLLCTNSAHPVMVYLQKLQIPGHQVKIIHNISEAAGGDILFLVSCSDFVKKSTRDLYKKTLVLHASDLPHGRGWSPHIWTILRGENKIVVSLLEAADKIDTGDIWKKESVDLEGHELFDEINNKVFKAEINLILWAVDNFNNVSPTPQPVVESISFEKRSPKDSEIDMHKTLKESFNLLRVCDPDRFPAFFTYMGRDYKIKIEKIKKD
ncbi:MAG: formyltransferase family protein [Bacteriovorax sp.]|jgi:methionyl-tRNA formyltransferase